MFYRFLTFFFRLVVYRGYYKKYNISKKFKFNGYLIRIYGQGEIVCLGEGYISFFSYLNVVKGSKLVIGDKVSIAHNVKIYTSSFDPEMLVCHGVKENVIADICIGDNVLIGSNSFICPGVTIGDNVVIGANSVVSKDIPSNTVAAGVPAKVIKDYSCV